MQAKEVSIHFRIGQIVTRDVGQRAETLVDVVVLRMLDNVFADLLSVAEERFVVVVRGQVAVDHFGVVAHSYLCEKLKAVRLPVLCGAQLFRIEIIEENVFVSYCWKWSDT